MPLALAALPAQAQFLNFKQVLERPDRPQPTQRLAYGPLPQQVGELWLPSAAKGPFPVVLMVHGGCWLADLPGPELLAWQAEALRQQGLAVWSISYRRLGHEGGGYPGTFQDVARGADHLRTLAQTQPLDLSRVVATGHSAGGHLALWLAARKNLPATSPLATQDPLPIHAVVPVAGVGDLAWGGGYVGGACGPDTVPKLVNEKERGKQAWSDTSPAALLPLGVPVTMVSGLYDPIVAPAHARRFQAEAARKGGVPVQLLTLDEASHFELISPWTEPGRRVVERVVSEVKGLGGTR
ncbi:MAG: alpha/beta hydrolase [Burkholderiales bacterium]|nr:MAG: alpha/beta hydrolase [Burkholderiales bacterium]